MRSQVLERIANWYYQELEQATATVYMQNHNWSQCTFEPYGGLVNIELFGTTLSQPDSSMGPSALVRSVYVSNVLNKASLAVNSWEQPSASQRSAQKVRFLRTMDVSNWVLSCYIPSRIITVILLSSCLVSKLYT